MEETKKWYQSATIRNSIVGLVVSLLTLIAAITGKTFDIAAIQGYIDQGWALVPFAVTAYTSARAIVARKKADTTIEKK